MAGRPGFSPEPVLAKFPPGATQEEIATRCGVKTNTVAYWRQGRTLRLSTADHVALCLGLHPVNLWPEWEL